jgi:hypothetical protein
MSGATNYFYRPLLKLLINSLTPLKAPGSEKVFGVKKAFGLLLITLGIFGLFFLVIAFFKPIIRIYGRATYTIYLHQDISFMLRMLIASALSIFLGGLLFFSNLSRN